MLVPRILRILASKAGVGVGGGEQGLARLCLSLDSEMPEIGGNCRLLSKPNLAGYKRRAGMEDWEVKGSLTLLAIRKPVGSGDGALPKMRSCSALDRNSLVAAAAPQVQGRPHTQCEVSRSYRTTLARSAQLPEPENPCRGRLNTWEGDS